ncbi:Glycosyl transferase, group 2 protein [Pseudomonas amygdali pv. lachrymans]|nr:Glycosyl transferase [Pseudomonas amygdali pv. lachrymans]KPC20617.1 Glycosyl transferase [Pseudomonas amygdali pv. lachrymans]RMM50384.1 Glycosyl transferase, group 2 protein [Pseudomonas amygdali pv. lachrymans]RMP21419.1 Glycosyl transferase, group 2 protein [Pseudomonas amygdali pv. lachrymans]RMT12327.1 Glycosyl transferase, group 2 protein [Pseudomonas amygdali pv. lachrymans]
MLSALPVILGTQFILAFIGHDVQAVPKRAFHLLRKNRSAAEQETK